MENPAQDIDLLGMLSKLDDRVLEIHLAHSKMFESLFDVFTVAKEINPTVSKKWFLVVESHKQLGTEIRQLLQELKEIKHKVNANTQIAEPES